MSDATDPLLLALKTGGPAPASVLARKLGITRQAARVRLERLERDGLTASGPVRPRRPIARGRPARGWRLTAKGHGRFPDAHERVTVELIAATRRIFGEDGLDRLIEAREQASAQACRVRLAGAATLEEKLERLAVLRSEEGYMARWIAAPDGSFLFIEDHCPICAAATACQGFCRAELALFADLLAPASVERSHHLLSGASRCAYRITPQGRAA